MERPHNAHVGPFSLGGRPMFPTYDRDLAARLTARRERDGTDKAFYDSAAWRHLRAKVLAEFHGECQDCLEMSPARYTPAAHIHHEMHVQTHPGWALSEFYVDQSGEVRRNLVPLCHDCHDRRHGRVGYRPHTSQDAQPLTDEWW